MIEIFNILLQTFVFFIIFSFPFNQYILNKTFRLDKINLGLIDTQAINIIFFSYICLIISLFEIDINIFFKIYISLSILFILINRKHYFTQIKKNNFIKFIIFFLITFSIFIFISQNVRLEWDGHVWISKALIFFNGEKITNINETLHSDYPHLGTYLWAFFWSNSYLELEYFGRYFYVYFYLISIFLILQICDIKSNYLKIFLILFFILLTFEPYYFAGYQEYLIFSSLVIASRYIFVFNQKNNNNNINLILLIIFILYLNSWFKNEGGVYFIIFSIPLIYLAGININKKLLLILLAIFLILIQYSIEKYLIKNIGYSNSEYLINFFESFNDIKSLFVKTSKILLNILIVFVKHPLWMIIFLSIFVQKLIFKKINFTKNYFLICIALNLLTIFTVYITMNNIDFMLKVTLDRVLFQTSGFYLVLFLSVLNFLKTKNK